MPGLAALIRSKYPGAYDDLDDAALEQQVLAKYPEYADLAKPAPSHEAQGRTWTDTAVDALPMVGGMAGGMLGAGGGPLTAVAGAGAGGMVGSRLKQYANALRGTQPLPPAGEAIGEMGKDAAIQAGSEVGGRLIGGALKAGAGRLYQSVLKPTMAARTEYPELIQTGLKAGVPVSKGGVERAGELVGQSRAAADALVTDRAAQPGAPMIDPKQAVGGITRAVKDVQDLPVARPQMKAIGDYGRAYIREHPQPMALPDAQRAVRATDRFFDSSYRATMDRGNPVTSGSTAAALGINNETRNLLRQAVPGLAQQNAQTSQFKGLADAIERRVGQQGNLSAVGMQHAINAGLGATVGAVGGKERGAGTFLTMEALTNPAVASRLAIGAARAGAHPSVISNATRAALLALMDEP
jgi:hypothetical protein